MAQNVISRIAHGLIGLDLFTQRGEENNYLRDFLTLKASELHKAFAAAPGAKLVPNSSRPSLEEWNTFIKKILNAQEFVKAVETAGEEDIRRVAKDLQDSMTFFYGHIRR